MSPGDVAQVMVEELLPVDVGKDHAVAQRDLGPAWGGGSWERRPSLPIASSTGVLYPSPGGGDWGGLLSGPDLQADVLGIGVDDLVEHPVLDLEDEQSDGVVVEDEVGFAIFDLGCVPHQEVVVGLRHLGQPAVDAALAVGVEAGNALGDMVAMTASRLGRDVSFAHNIGISRGARLFLVTLPLAAGPICR